MTHLADRLIAAACRWRRGRAQQTPQDLSLRRSTRLHLRNGPLRLTGSLVTDLTKDDFEIQDNGKLRDVTIFSREIVPITVVMMLDMSGSQEAGVDWIREAAARVCRIACCAADRARIGTFGIEIAISPRLTVGPGLSASGAAPKKSGRAGTRRCGMRWTWRCRRLRASQAGA